MKLRLVTFEIERRPKRVTLAEETVVLVRISKCIRVEEEIGSDQREREREREG